MYKKAFDPLFAHMNVSLCSVSLVSSVHKHNYVIIIELTSHSDGEGTV